MSVVKYCINTVYCKLQTVTALKYTTVNFFITLKKGCSINMLFNTYHCKITCLSNVKTIGSFWCQSVSHSNSTE